MPLAENQDVVQTLAPHAAEEAFADGVDKRRAHCASNDKSACALRTKVRKKFADAIDSLCAALCGSLFFVPETVRKWLRMGSPCPRQWENEERVVNSLVFVRVSGDR